ncbi:hypothetical protein PMAYCL1PPCAC_19422, partial [Pristionchus mayeri]
DEGWTVYDENNQESILKMEGTNYHIKAHCEQLCHEETLTADATKKGSRKYTFVVDNADTTRLLTCEKDDEKLEFEAVDPDAPKKLEYTDLICTKKGWTSNHNAKKNIKFM